MRMRSIALLLAAALITLPLSAEACSWKLISSPNPGANNVLQGVSGSSTSDVWSVGKYYSTSGGPFTLAEHWNGSTWSVVSTPNPASGNNLYGVADIASNDAWAVGSERPSSGGFQALILHWNGKKWSQVTAPTLAGHFTNLQAIAGINSTNIWADGLALPVSGGILAPLIEHWDGKKWSIISSPNLGTYGSTTYGISASSGKDVWATGGTSLNSQNTDYATFAMHWTGSKWNIVSTPNVGTIDSLLNAVIDLSPTDAWAVGDDYNGTRRIFDTLTEHWDGTKWSVVTSPTVGPYGNGLYGVGAVSPNAVWAVGQEFTSGASLTLSLKWNGKLWAHVKSPNLPGGNPDFYAAAAGIPGGTTLWAVGLSTFPSGNADGTLTTSNACALTDSGDDFFPVPLRRADRTRSEPHR